MKQSPGKIFLRFLRFGLLAWGGPVAQIAMIKKELVEEEKWVSPEQFNRALAVYQVLPGPEAHELCVYFGMKVGGRFGGFLAGLGFMLPGFVLMLLCTWVYVQFGIQSSIIKSLFSGIQVGVVALIVFAVYRIGKHTIVNTKLLIISMFSGIAFFAGVNFLIVLLTNGACYVFWQKKQLLVVIIFVIFIVSGAALTIYKKEPGLKISHEGSLSENNYTSLGTVFISGLKGGLLTFGGAYTAIPFMQQDAVVKHKWMTRQQFLDGIALSGILPAPLIIFSTFVGYFAGGWLGAIIITIGIFLPAFGLTLIGHSVMEKLIANTALHDFLDGVAAGVVGLIAITAIQLFALTVITLPAFIVFTLSSLVLMKYRSKYTVLLIIIGAGLFGLAWSFI